MLRVSTPHWQSDRTSVSMLMEDMSRNKCFFQGRISHGLRSVSICDLFTDSPSYIHTCILIYVHLHETGCNFMSVEVNRRLCILDYFHSFERNKSRPNNF
jgi:hypothetical protein